MRKAYYFHGNPIKVFLKKNYCPYCESLLALTTNHKIVNSKSAEAKKYQSLFEGLDGGILLGNFDSDIVHKVFYCGECNAEIEPKTLFSYQKVLRYLSKISKKANNKKVNIKINYLPFGKSVKADLSFFEILIIDLAHGEHKISQKCFVAKKYLTYEEATYFEKTKESIQIRRFLKDVAKKQ